MLDMLKSFFLNKQEKAVWEYLCNPDNFKDIPAYKKSPRYVPCWDRSECPVISEFKQHLPPGTISERLGKIFQRARV